MDMGELGVGKEGAIAITIVHCRLKRKRDSCIGNGGPRTRGRRKKISYIDLEGAEGVGAI